MALLIEQIEVGGFDDNFSYLIYGDNRKGVVIDPSGDTLKIFAVVKRLRLKITGIWLTHTHLDHMDGVPAALNQFGDIPIYVQKLGFDSVGNHENVIIIDDQDLLEVEDHKVKVLHTPGHLDDSVCFFIAAADTLDKTPKIITGDTLFVGGCGRTTPTRVKDLYESLQELKSLPLETEVFPGHDYGPSQISTIERELAENKYYQVANFNEFKELRLE